MKLLNVILERLSWKFDMAVYRLFYCRWLPRLKCDPNLAKMFTHAAKQYEALNNQDEHK